MATKRDKRGRKRNYKKEYKRDHAPKKDRKDRSSRNKARRRKGLKVGDKREVHHKDGNPSNNARSNLKVTSSKKNTTISNKKRAKKKKKKRGRKRLRVKKKY